MKYLLSNYSSYTEANSNENLNIRQSYVCPVVSTYTSENTYSYDGKYIHIENNGFFGADIIPDAYTKCRYIYNTAKMVTTSGFGFNSPSTLNQEKWIVKCSWQSSYINENNGTGDTEIRHQMQLFGNGQIRRNFGIRQGKIWYDYPTTNKNIVASTDPLNPQEIIYETVRKTDNTSYFNITMYVDNELACKSHSGGFSATFIGSPGNNYIVGSHPYYPVWCYWHHAQIYQDYILVHNLVPCKRNSDGQYGFYDTVDNTWHGHASLSGVEINASISQIDSTTMQIDPTAISVEPAEPIFIGG